MKKNTLFSLLMALTLTSGLKSQEFAKDVLIGATSGAVAAGISVLSFMHDTKDERQHDFNVFCGITASSYVVLRNCILIENNYMSTILARIISCWAAYMFVLDKSLSYVVDNKEQDSNTTTLNEKETNHV